MGQQFLKKYPLTVVTYLQISAREEELELTRQDADRGRREFEQMLGAKLALDTEIAVYKALLDSEEKRVSRFALKNRKLVVML